MFTGIIEEVGIVQSIKRTGESFVLTIGANKIMNDIKLGDSIAINGVCLTVTTYTTTKFSVDVMPETVKATSLATVTQGSRVNLERAMAAGGRFGGHFVSGHVDGTGTIVAKDTVENAVYYEIETNNELLKYIILRGSVTVDGTSLTVFGVSENSFTLSIIPHTLSETVLGIKGKGDIVNIECDMLGKYVSHFLNAAVVNGAQKSSGITESFLEENGFK
ncbi:MAG: riboflavin synthase [Heyndrickxia sp.]